MTTTHLHFAPRHCDCSFARMLHAAKRDEPMEVSLFQPKTATIAWNAIALEYDLRNSWLTDNITSLRRKLFAGSSN